MRSGNICMSLSDLKYMYVLYMYICVYLIQDSCNISPYFVDVMIALLHQSYSLWRHWACFASHQSRAHHCTNNEAKSSWDQS